jgi:hypothetical protein
MVSMRVFLMEAGVLVVLVVVYIIPVIQSIVILCVVLLNIHVLFRVGVLFYAIGVHV